MALILKEGAAQPGVVRTVVRVWNLVVEDEESGKKIQLWADVSIESTGKSGVALFDAQALGKLKVLAGNYEVFQSTLRQLWELAGSTAYAKLEQTEGK